MNDGREIILLVSKCGFDIRDGVVQIVNIASDRGGIRFHTVLYV